MKIIRFKSQSELKKQALILLEEHLALRSPNPHAIMLPGGRTPFALYRELAENPPPVDQSLHIILSDERHVPYSATASNYGRMLPLLEQAGIDARRILHPGDNAELAERARGYDHRLAEFFERGGEITLGVLGIGADGHTASLFNAADLSNFENPYSVAIRKDEPPHRISVTRKLISASERIIFLCIGGDKNDIVATIEIAPDGVVAAQAASAVADVELWYAQ